MSDFSSSDEFHSHLGDLEGVHALPAEHGQHDHHPGHGPGGGGSMLMVEEVNEHHLAPAHAGEPWEEHGHKEGQGLHKCKILVAIVVVVSMVLTVLGMCVALWGIMQTPPEPTKTRIVENKTMVPPSVKKLQSDILKLLGPISDNQSAAFSTARGQGNQISMFLQQFFLGKNSSYPATSCRDIFQITQSSPSGYYWIRARNGTAVQMYCDMTRSCGGVTGGWTRVANLDFGESSSSCPNSLKLSTTNRIRSCGSQSPAPGCASVSFETVISYNSVCGKIIGYQKGSTEAFHRSSSPTIDQNYVDGVSLTHGTQSRTHIWTFVAALSEGDSEKQHACSCSNTTSTRSTTAPPAFVKTDYFCDTGVQGPYLSSYNQKIFVSNRLWDGKGCGLDSACCGFNNPPWFYKKLSESTNNDIELRLCRDSGSNNEDVLLTRIKLYIQ